ncbi:MAG: acyl carrier protein, partial [Thermotogaceae bacterium]|nr:acyl carrier protein [Thermotogaceae bacterium]
VLKTIADVLKAEIDEYTMKIDVPSWDSLKHIQLIMEVEEKFGVEIPIEKVPDIDSISVLLGLVGAEEG